MNIARLMSIRPSVFYNNVRLVSEFMKIHLRSYLDAGAGFGSEDSYRTES